jgi:hypothetical protein
MVDEISNEEELELGPETVGWVEIESIDIDPDAGDVVEAARKKQLLTRRARPFAIAEGLGLVVRGLWPFAHAASFRRVIGRSRDEWFMKTTGIVGALAGAALLIGGARRRRGRLTPILGLTSALAMAAVDVVHLRDRRFRRPRGLVALDVLKNAVIAGGWVRALLRQRGRAVLRRAANA